jgi:DNA polymerase III subunit delta'
MSNEMVSISNLHIVTSVWDSVLGQDRAVDHLQHSVINPVHAYLLVGPEGCGKEEAARALAGVLLAGNDDATDRNNDMAVRGTHPDIHEVKRDGASILKNQAEEVIKIASTTPNEGNRKAIIMHEVHLMQPSAAARLLKTVEEPPNGVFFVMLAEQVDDSLVTIASRCMTIHFGPLDAAVIEHVLASEGVKLDVAEIAAQSAHGSLTRGRLLAGDKQLAHRREFFANIPRRIDGTGATVAAIVEQILSLIDDSAAPLQQRHEQEIVDTEKTLALMGVKRGGKKALEDKHKREIRRFRTDELRNGLTEVASVYRDELARNEHIHRPEGYVTAIHRLHEAMRRLGLNVNEAILLRDLIWSLPSPSADAALQFVLEGSHE